MLAIVGGTGRLPDILAEARPDAARYAANGVTFGSGKISATGFRLEQLGRLVDDLRSGGVRQIVFAGAMRRPWLDPLALDEFTREALAFLGSSLRGGDDALLRGVITVFERAGFEVIAAHDVLPALMPAPGVISGSGPNGQDRSDAERGFAILDALGPFDVGQACVVAGGQVLAIEGMGGTDWMLGTLKGDMPGRPVDARPSGVLCKGPKMGQDRRIDVPTIGPDTVAGVSAAGLRGIVIEAGGVNVLDLEETVAASGQAGTFLWVREA